MNGEELKEFTEGILDGQVIDNDFFYQLLNVAKTKLEEERMWQYLIKLDSSKTATSGSNPDISYELPTDFAEPYKLFVGRNAEYFPVRFEEQHIYRNTARRYFIDIANEVYYLLGNVRGDTIYQYYKRFTPEIAEAVEPVFPERFHPVLGFMVAGYYQMGVDADDIFARMSPENKLAALELKKAMVGWDARLQLAAQGDRTGMEGGGGEDEFPLGLM